MAIRTDSLRKSLASAYISAAPNGALFTADPGNTGSATGEVTGGSPAYARKAMGFGAPTTAGVTAVSTSAATTFDVPSGVTVAFFATTASTTAGTADVRDTFDVVDQAFSSQGTYAMTATITIS